MQRKRPDVDIILDILNACVEAQPGSSFAKSLLNQYQERGGLSKKQLEGLYNKAAKVESIPPNKLATLEAEIKKRPNRYKSEAPAPTPLYTRDERLSILADEILAKYPEHKRVIFLKTKYENNEPLSPNEISELERFHKMLKK
jgi:hypothetical protein